eukprot:8370180-Alexandrium_andersonii.AAC.1
MSHFARSSRGVHWGAPSLVGSRGARVSARLAPAGPIVDLPGAAAQCARGLASLGAAALVAH